VVLRCCPAVRRAGIKSLVYELEALGPLPLDGRGQAPAPVLSARWNELASGPLFSFADWPNNLVPRRAAGVYTIWRRSEFIYVGMSGRGAQREDLVAGPGQPAQAKGLWTRLNSHASGRRSGDQFNIYICDRFIVPALTPAQQDQIGHGDLLLDQMTRSYIRKHLGYRFTTCADGTEALTIEHAVRGGALPAGRPYLNPL
jgi:hypothetical protein